LEKYDLGFTFKDKPYSTITFDYGRNMVEKIVYDKREVTSRPLLEQFYMLIEQPNNVEHDNIADYE